MFEYFRFSLPRAVTEQLVERLEKLPASSLTEAAIEKLWRFQKSSETTQGVYVIYLGKKASYAGKAQNVTERLGKHLLKLRGRRKVDLRKVRYKALLLDENWSTSANEGLLINHFKNRGECEWNGSGFGPKDTGKNRDDSIPNKFDNAYPIRDDYPLTDIPNISTVGFILAEIKKQTPFLFRYQTPGEAANVEVDLSGIPRTARAIATHTAQSLGKAWQLMLFKSCITLYRTNKSYANGTQLFP
ncbi:MAG: GIY-YIG nuclease family protein [Terrimicrobiaceae bacterium]